VHFHPACIEEALGTIGAAERRWSAIVLVHVQLQQVIDCKSFLAQGAGMDFIVSHYVTLQAGIVIKTFATFLTDN